MTKILQRRDVTDAGRKPAPAERDRALGAAELDQVVAAGGSKGGSTGSGGGAGGSN